jgi:hypothetical protein
MFMDFRNPLLIEVLSKMTSRFRRIAFSEMLPRLEHCWLEGPGGNYSCEFRTVIMATQESRKAGNPLLGRSSSAISNEKVLCATV